MVRVKIHGGVTNRWIVDDGEYRNGRVVDSIKTNGKIGAHTDDGWLVFTDGYLSFVGNHAVINPNPTPIIKGAIVCRNQNFQEPFSKGYKHRHGEPVSDACGDGRHLECDQDLTKCHCTFRGGHSTMHAYANVPAEALRKAAPQPVSGDAPREKPFMEAEDGT